MDIVKHLIKYWIVFVVPIISIQLIVNYYSSQRNEKMRSIYGYVGSEFSLHNFQDINGRVVDLDFSNSDLTIIDFWHKACPPCIVEMKNYKRLVEGHGKELSIVSISVNDYRVWKELFTKKSDTFDFLTDSVSNWKHLAFKSGADPKLKNSIPSDNIRKLNEAFQTNSFPTYLVVNRKGIIVATPESAVDYIRINLHGKNKFFTFLINPITLHNSYIWIPRLIVFYSGFFWIGLMIVLIVKKIKSS